MTSTQLLLPKFYIRINKQSLNISRTKGVGGNQIELSESFLRQEMKEN